MNRPRNRPIGQSFYKRFGPLADNHCASAPSVTVYYYVKQFFVTVFLHLLLIILIYYHDEHFHAQLFPWPNTFIPFIQLFISSHYVSQKRTCDGGKISWLNLRRIGAFSLSCNRGRGVVTVSSIMCPYNIPKPSFFADKVNFIFLIVYGFFSLYSVQIID